jgi:hypothetical protein
MVTVDMVDEHRKADETVAKLQGYRTPGEEGYGAVVYQ